MVFSPLSDKNSLFQLVNYIATSDVNIFRVVAIFSHRRLCRSEFIQATRDSNISQFYKKKKLVSYANKAEICDYLDRAKRD